MKENIKKIKEFIENELYNPYRGQEFEFYEDGENQIEIIADCWTLTMFPKNGDIEVQTKKGCCVGQYDLEYFMDIYHNLDKINEIYKNIEEEVEL